MEDFKLNERLQLAFDYLFYTGRNVFLTGKAGTGKTTFLKRLRQKSPKRMIVTSPTGVAAVNAGGVTLHSFFQLPLGPQIPGAEIKENRKYNFNKTKIDIIRSLELLVIDEISMVRADLLDSVDAVLRRYRSNNKPFGGLQLLLIGDMQQLSPVVRPEDEEILKPYYDTYYFFGSRAWQQTSYVCIELNQVFRQTDQNFISILNEIRDGVANDDTINRLNKQYIPNYQPPEGEDIVTLVTTNKEADRINQSHMMELSTSTEVFKAEVNGEFPDSAYPVESSLVLKKDAVVMFLKNDPTPAKQFFNGKIGRITGFEDGSVIVKCKGDADEIKVGPLTWDNSKYTVNSETKEIEEKVVGTFKQIPLKTAWAVTIHKSQGLTFDKLMLNASNSFAHGQVYVALSRCRTLEGLVLLKPLSIRDLIYDTTINRFAQIVEARMPNNSILITDKRDYYFETVADLFDFYPIYNSLQSLERQVAIASPSVFGNHQTIKGLDSVVLGQMISVSEKFVQNIRYNYKDSVDIEAEDSLRERICNGCKFYIDKMLNLLERGIISFGFVCDDKNKSTKIHDAMQEMLYQYKFKKAILESSKDSFTLQNYLQCKAKLSMDLSKGQDVDEMPRRRWSNSDDELVSKNTDLFSLLLNWRRETADNLNVESKEIVATRTLVEISDKEPETIDKLLAIKGMGGKAKKFSSDILKIVFKYLASHGKTVSEDELQKADYEKLTTQDKTYHLFKQGRTPDQICKDRGLKIETILSHLAKYAALGEIDPLDLMPKENFDSILKYLKNHAGASDKQIVSALKSNASYGEIKVVRAILESDSDI